MPGEGSDYRDDVACVLLQERPTSDVGLSAERNKALVIVDLSAAAAGSSASDLKLVLDNAGNLWKKN